MLLVSLDLELKGQRRWGVFALYSDFVTVGYISDSHNNEIG